MYNNSFSRTMNPNLIRNNQQQQQQQQSGFRNEYQGVVQGLQSLLTISYSSIQMLTFGRIFIDMTKKLLTFIQSTSTSVVNKLLSLLKIKQLLNGELTMTQLGKSVVVKSANLANKWIILLQVLLLCVVVAIAALYKHMCMKIKEKLIQEQQEEQQTLQQQQEEQKQCEDEENTQQPIQQQDFWNHTEECPDQFQQSHPSTQISQTSTNYLQDLPGFSAASNNSKPWMK